MSQEPRQLTLDDLGKLFAEISREVTKIDLLFAEETLDVRAFDRFIIATRATLWAAPLDLFRPACWDRTRTSQHHRPRDWKSADCE
jgi:hypothetical protein